MSGSVYILSTDKFETYKCGFTTNSVSKRREQLQTSCVNNIEILKKNQEGSRENYPPVTGSHLNC